MSVIVSPAVARVLERCPDARPCGAGFIARCRGHDDRRPSLSIGQGAKGAVLKCFRGCSIERIVAGLGLRQRDLFDEEDLAPGRRPARLAQPPRPRLATTEQDLARYRERLDDRVLARLEELRGWTPETVRRLGLGFDGSRVTIPVRDAAGALVGLLRYSPNPDRRNGPKLVAAAGSRRELFPPPETLLASVPTFLVEGEGDGLRLLSLGLAACAVPGTEAWRPAEWAARFAGRRVCVLFDCDEAGRRAACRVAEDLAGAVAEVRLLDLDPRRSDGYDVSDFLAGARTGAERDEARRIMLRCFQSAPRIDREAA